MDLGAIFTEERLVKIICLEIMQCLRLIECSYEASLLHLDKHLFVSTYSDEFIDMDRFLNDLHERYHRNLKTACSVDGRVF
jgi:hypothetical protein